MDFSKPTWLERLTVFAVSAVLLAMLGGIGWLAWLSVRPAPRATATPAPQAVAPPPAIPAPLPPPDPAAQARAEAVEMLGAAGSARQAGDLGIAWELARQAVAKSPNYTEAQNFLKAVEAQRAEAERARVAAVIEYRATVVRRMRLYKDASISAGAKASAWSRVPILSFDNDWTKPGAYQDQVLLLTFALGHWELTAEALADISPVPPEGAGVQAKLVAVAAETKAITRDVNRAVQARDQQSLAGLDARVDRLIRTAAQTLAEAEGLK